MEKIWLTAEIQGYRIRVMIRAILRESSLFCRELPFSIISRIHTKFRRYDEYSCFAEV
jgi:hypothetical protein